MWQWVSFHWDSNSFKIQVTFLVRKKIEDMKVLQLNKELLSLYSFWYNSDGTPWHIKLIRQIKITLMIFCLLFGWASSVVLIVKYIAIDLQKSLYAVFQVAAEFGANYTVVVACLYPESTEGIFKRLNDIRDKGNISNDSNRHGPRIMRHI